MTDTTTIQIRTDQLDALDRIAASDSEPRKETLQRLIDNYSGEDEAPSEDRVRELAREEVRDAVVFEALE